MNKKLLIISCFVMLFSINASDRDYDSDYEGPEVTVTITADSWRTIDSLFQKFQKGKASPLFNEWDVLCAHEALTEYTSTEKPKKSQKKNK